MKNLLFMCFLAQSLFFVSCQKDEQVIEEEANVVLAESFVGIWQIADLACTGPMADWDEYEDEAVVITKNTNADALFVDFGDDVIFNAYVENNKLIIDTQTLNADQDFDVITLSAVAEMNDDETLAMDFTHIVDDEGVSDCTITLTK